MTATAEFPYEYDQQVCDLWHDLHWGKCTCQRHNGAGDNYLGRLLMELRDELASKTTR